MARRLSDKEKKEIIQGFTEGISIEDLAKRFNFTKLTISRNLKRMLGQDHFEELKREKSAISINSKKIVNKISNIQNKESLLNKNLSEEKEISDNLIVNETLNNTYNPEFIELAPLDYDLDNSCQKDISSIPLSNVEFPKVVFMIVNKNIELKVKILRDYPDWHFLPDNDLDRKTIEIFNDLKIAKSNCNKDQKVIKVPNTEVFKITAPILLSRGITRIINDEKLIAL